MGPNGTLRPRRFSAFVPNVTSSAGEVYEDEDDHLKNKHRTVDEVKNLNKLVCFETNSLRCWRFIVIILLLATGAAIAAFTFTFLREEEDEGFRTTVRRSQFIISKLGSVTAVL